VILNQENQMIRGAKLTRKNPWRKIIIVLIGGSQTKRGFAFTFCLDKKINNPDSYRDKPIRNQRTLCTTIVYTNRQPTLFHFVKFKFEEIAA